MVTDVVQLVEREGLRVRPLKRREFDHLVSAGVFERERVELIRGVLVEMSPVSPEHHDVVEVLGELLIVPLAKRAGVRPQLSLASSDTSELRPDMLIVDRRIPRHSGEHPSSALLVIEVSDSSLRFDRKVKAPLYAEANIPEYWIIDVAHQCVEVYSQPDKGIYQRLTKLTGDEILRPIAFPDIAIPVTALFTA